MKKYLKVISILSTLTALAACQFNQVKVITKDRAKNIVKDIANHNKKCDNKYGNAYTYHCHQEVNYKNHGLVIESTQEDFKNTTFESIYYNEITERILKRCIFIKLVKPGFLLSMRIALILPVIIPWKDGISIKMVNYIRFSWMKKFKIPITEVLRTTHMIA